ncbi:MAG: hypothetical protein KGD58_15870 [Candidatus Lokiarchaeota archaeon]|nr:hypothetical protein [Candidatus Lokiarchaeota archaeon]
MTNCYFCNEKINDIPYRCTFCGMILCSKHRIPENHDCPFDLRKSSEFEESLNSLNILYQDALDFINKDLTVAKIYEYVTTNQMNNLEATELLTYFIEKNDDINTRRISILAFKVLQLKNNEVFDTLENCILDKDNSIVKDTAIQVMKQLFPKKSKTVLKWSENNKNNSRLI